MSSETLPDPPIGPEVDCTDLDSFMLNTERLLGSELVAVSSHAIIGAAVLLWCRAWKQRPAASLPDDERVLAGFAGMQLARFRKVRDKVLRGFVKCSDGRLYHPVLAAEAAVAYHKMKIFRTQLESKKIKKTAMRAAKKARKSAIPGESVPGTDSGHTGTLPPPPPPPAAPLLLPPQTPLITTPHHPPTPTTTSRAPDGAAGGGGRDFAFEGTIIRLAQLQFDRWKARYHAIPDLVAELEAFDAKLVDEGLGGKWFARVAGWLNAKHQAFAAKPGGTSRPGADFVASTAVYAPESPQHWRDRLRVWFDRQQGSPDPDSWPDTWGPPLGDPDCRVPAEVLAEFRKEG